MTDSILQFFLNGQFIKTDEPTHITNLEKASAEVQKRLMKKKPSIISYTLVALDPTISDDDSIIGEVETLIIKQWPTFRNSVAKTKDKPSTYIQAVILDALNELSKDESVAAIIWLTGCNIVNHYKLAGREKLLANFLMKIGKKVEEVARNNWTIFENLKMAAIKPIELTLPEVSEGKVGEAELQGHLKAAAVHSGWAGSAGGGENPYLQGQNNWQWPNFLAERAAKGLSKEINAALSAQSKSIISLSNSVQKAINLYIANLTPYLEQVSSSILQSSRSLNKRIELIWWKQALYSRALDSSYRTLSPLCLAMAMAMAVDLAATVHPIYPKSVDFLLEETLHDVLGKETNTEIAVAELLKQLQQLPKREKHLLDVLSNEDEGRKSLGTCTANMMKEKMNTKEFFKHTGLETKAKISLGEFTVWLFHDLQANTLANMK
ncbi:hypothetical protein D4S03_11065 [bacterium]|nr:MAG: hypothetical protein D4S03_11065 [bacterium]